jgi:hypothetical protein
MPEYLTPAYSITQEVRPEDIATFEQREIAKRFAEHNARGRKEYWQTCRAAYEAYEEHQKNYWPDWASTLANEAGLKEPDTIRNRLKAYQFYILGSMFDKPLTDSVRSEKTYTYFQIAMDYAEPNESRVVSLLHDIRAADSTRDLRIHLAKLYDDETDLTRYLRRLEAQKDSMLRVALDGLGFGLPRHLRDDLKRVALDLENWHKKRPLD